MVHRPSLDEPIWSPTTFSQNRDRLLQADVAGTLFDAVVNQAREAGLMSDEHLTADGTVLKSIGASEPRAPLLAAVTASAPVVLLADVFQQPELIPVRAKRQLKVL